MKYIKINNYQINMKKFISIFWAVCITLSLFAQVKSDIAAIQVIPQPQQTELYILILLWK
jgi:hypothetical protein